MKELERFMGTSLMVADGRGLVDENPVLCLRCTPNRHPPCLPDRNI